MQALQYVLIVGKKLFQQKNVYIEDKLLTLSNEMLERFDWTNQTLLTFKVALTKNCWIIHLNVILTIE